MKYRVEQLLEIRQFGRAMESDLAEWVKGLDLTLAKKLARVGLIPDPKGESVTSLGTFLDGWLSRRKGDYKVSSVIAWRQVVEGLKRYFGATTPLPDITPDKAESFRRFLIESGLRATTIQKRLQHARMFFADATRQKLIPTNPFAHVRHRLGDVSERRQYVPEADVLRVIEFAPTATWKLLIALSRFGGLRVPSEALSLRWADIDWERQRITVPSPKTEHIAGRGYRVIPLFPVLRPYLDAAWEAATEGADYIFPEEIRKRALGPGGWANANLRTMLSKFIRRAGVESWSRLWHSMRASCESDLARRFPLAVVCKWLGNTQAVALRHYIDVTDDDFRKALEATESGNPKAAQKAAQQVTAVMRNEWQTFISDKKETPGFPGFSEPCELMQGCTVEDNGLEPMTSCMP
jgi:integrase